MLFQPKRYFFQRDLKVVVLPAVLFSVLLSKKNIIVKQKKMCAVFCYLLLGQFDWILMFWLDDSAYLSKTGFLE